MKTAYKIGSKLGRTKLKNSTDKLVTHLLQNESWLNSKITELQNLADAARAAADLDTAYEYEKSTKEYITEHRLFVSELLPYCLPKLSATMSSDGEEAAELVKELMGVGKNETSNPDILTPSSSATNVEAPDADE